MHNYNSFGQGIGRAVCPFFAYAKRGGAPAPCLIAISEPVGEKRGARSLILYTVSHTNERENWGVL